LRFRKGLVIALGSDFSALLSGVILVSKSTLRFVGDGDINVRRRHMNESQRAMIAAKLATLHSGQRADYANAGAGEEISTPVGAARTVRRDGG
jgi:hypothetical protein